MTPAATRQADELREALTIGREAAYEVAQNYHTSMAGYRRHEHDRLDADVKKIDDAIDKLASMIPAGGLAEEARRTDWLESMANKPGGLLLHDGSERGRVGLGLRPGRLSRTLREAIDAAMASSTSQGKETL